jgi:hypothetical protein
LLLVLCCFQDSTLTVLWLRIRIVCNSVSVQMILTYVTMLATVEGDLESYIVCYNVQFYSAEPGVQ